MRPEQLEAWVLAIVDRVRSGQRNEDDRVELKAEWPTDTAKAARRVAGHANASRGDSVLWVVGLDEDRGVVPVSSVDPATWLQQLEAQFDGLSPSVQTLSIPTDGGAVYALLFDTSRKPFVVRNPLFGNGPGSVSLEVPWRDGTSIRTARREDLLRLLVPTVRLPTFEVLDATASLYPVERERMCWSASLELYVTPRTNERVVIPRHRVELEFRTDRALTFHAVSTQRMQIKEMGAPFWHTGSGTVRDSQTIRGTSGEVLIAGPGRLNVSGHFNEPAFSLYSSVPEAEVRLTLRVADDDRPIDVVARLLPLRPQRDANEAITKYEWNLTGERPKPAAQPE